MPELAFVVYMLALAYGLGQLWYSVLDYRHDNWTRTWSFPFLGIIAGEALWANFLPAGPEFLGIHVLVAFVATLVAALVDLGIHALRPAPAPSLRPAHA